MSKDQARSLALGANHPSPRRTGPPDARFPSYVGSTPLHAQMPRCSGPTKREECSAPVPAAGLDFLARSFTQKRNATSLFSYERAPSRSRSSQQLQYSQSVADFLSGAKTLTPAFPAASPLPVRSWTRVQHSTPLLSWACALFGKSTREGGRSRRRKLQPQLQVRPSSHAEVSYSGGFDCGLERSHAISIP
jgi:hypothetical protein